MNRRITAVATGAALVVAALGATPVAQAASRIDDNRAQVRQTDDKPAPMSDKERATRKAAVEGLVKGTSKLTTNAKGKKVIKTAGGQYVNYDVNREESIFTILVEFGDKTLPAQGGAPGPLHNQIPQPDRAVNNSTIWAPDFDRAHYEDLMFGEGESFKDFYLKQSNGRFLAKGDVSDWVQVPYNEARYGHNPAEGDGTDEAEQYWAFVGDSVNAWYAKQKAMGKTDADIKAYLAQFDHVDRYDHDNDGDFNEPDGYVDHFQVIHAGEGEEAGGGAEGEDAIWSHRWQANADLAGKAGPATNKLGGAQIGDSGMWVFDYTTEPENGGLGVFTHEFGHDLGLPDLYDTKGGVNSTGFWTLMSSGSWLNDGTTDIGSKPGYMGPWEKLQLGWLDYATVEYGKDTQVKLGPADRGGKMPQAVLVKTPDAKKTTALPAPHSGATQWWSGARDDDRATLTRTIDLTGATSGSVSAYVATELEEGYDYLFAEVSTDGVTWNKVGAELTGEGGGYTQQTYDLSAYAGQKVQFRFRNKTDGGTHGLGSFIDDITVTVGGSVVLSDDVENGDNGWVAKDFTRVGSSVTESVLKYYLAENRVYSGYDRYLKTGPYNFGFVNTRPDWVEHFPYQDGLLVWFQDGAVEDNNTSQHPGAGQSLPVDARAKALRFPDGGAAGSRQQSFDATFGLEATDPITLHKNTTQVLEVPSQPAIPVFDDTNPNAYWDSTVPTLSTKVAGSGTRIAVLNSSKQGDSMQVKVSFTK